MIFGQMNTECDVDYVKTVLDMYDFQIHRIGRRIGTKSPMREFSRLYKIEPGTEKG